MREITAFTKYLKHYKGLISLNVLFNVFYVVFSVFSLTVVMPFLDIIFHPDKGVNILPKFAFSIDALKDYLNYIVTQQINQYNSKEAGLIFLAILITVIFFLKNLFRFLAQYFLAPIRNGIVRDIRIKLNNKILNLPLSYYNKSKKGDLVSSLTADVIEVEHGVLNILEVLVKEPLTILVSLVVLFAISYKLTLFVFLLILVIAFLIGALGKSLKKPSFQGQQQLGQIASLYDETITGIRIVKAFTAEKYRMLQFDKESNKFFHLMNKVLRKRFLSSPLTEFLSIAVFSSIVWFGGNEVLSGNVKDSVFIVYLLMFASLIAPAKSFSGAFYTLQKGLGAMQRIDKILLAKDQIKEEENAQEIKSFTNEIAFENVSFSYKNYDNENVIDDFSLKVKKGDMIALVGPSGAGKSTLADLLPRFYDVLEGQITVDGQDIRKYKKNDLRALMGVVTQEALLFNDTIRQNIAFGVDAKQADIIEAAKIANAHDFIMQMPKGYDTIIGDRGMNLSGGQRQRLTIARAILKNPPILILDEATSALDSESEKLVQEALNKLMRNRTSIVIAHRLSTIQYADEIVVMDKGKVVEKGNHISLLAKNGLYKKLVELQAF
ncbi:ABC transporter ATP-binding protein/permease [Chitinophagales bacterium]|nr:ABC transporter ATP-binding protein/permease [Chitinophagales bacterium]